MGENMDSPTPEEIKQRRVDSGLSQTNAGKLIHSNLKSWQRWEYDKNDMHPALWELFVLKTKKLV